MNEIARIKKEVKLKQWSEMVRCRNESGLVHTKWSTSQDVLLSVKASETGIMQKY